MNNMNRLCILLCFCLAILAKESVADKKYHENVKFMASVREYPLFLHKCSATFVKDNLLVTSASCLLCSNKCKLFVKVLKDHLELPQDEVHLVDKTIIHPRYEKDPSHYDIGIITLHKNLKNIKQIELPPSGMIPFGIASNIYTWHFQQDMKDYLFFNIKAKTISNAVCSTYLHRFVPSKYLCLLGNQTTEFGPFDLGSPAIGEDKYLLGLFGMPGVTENSKIVTYNSIFPVLSWVVDIVSHGGVAHNVPGKSLHSNEDETSFHSHDFSSYSEHF